MDQPEFGSKLRGMFGGWLATELERRGWSQKEFAQRLDVSESAVSSWITGTQTPGRRSARAIARILDLHPNDVLILIGFSPDPESANVRYRGYTPNDLAPPAVISQLVIVPVLGRAPADHLRWVGGNEPGVLLPSDDLEGIGSPAIVIASGDCLAKRGIRSGTRVLIDRTAVPNRPGDIVVIRVEDEITMKEWYPIEGGVILRASDEGYPPIFVREDQENVELIGVARLYYRVGRL